MNNKANSKSKMAKIGLMLIIIGMVSFSQQEIIGWVVLGIGALMCLSADFFK